MQKEYAHVIPKLSDPSIKGKALVIFKGLNKCIKYNDVGQMVETEEEVFMPFPIESVDDVSHVDFMRKAHGYSVVAVELLDNMKDQKAAKNIAAQIALLTRAPEAAAELAAAKSELEDLKAKLASVQGPSDAEAALKAQAAEIEALKEALAKAQTPTKTEGESAPAKTEEKTAKAKEK